ncbi:hypothetical protein KSS87_006654 [Heliosperma pusillum]|nr:hypothetical protein KSS87_006654 [Heliosperma pusillum]
MPKEVPPHYRNIMSNIRDNTSQSLEHVGYSHLLQQFHQATQETQVEEQHEDRGDGSTMQESTAEDDETLEGFRRRSRRTNTSMSSINEEGTPEPSKGKRIWSRLRPAVLVDVPRDSNITAEVMKSLHIPKGVRRVLFRTLNTDKRLMFKKEFDSSYVGFTEDGAQWLIDNTDIKLVGIDYLSAAAFDHLAPAHLVFLKGREILLVEGLKLDDVLAGMYNVHCLPLRLLGAEGSPIRCILMK